MAPPLRHSGESECGHGTGLRFQARANASDRADWRTWGRVGDVRGRGALRGLIRPWRQARPHWDFVAGGGADQGQSGCRDGHGADGPRLAR